MTVEPSFTALVLAGQRPGRDALADAAGVSHRCLVPTGGVPMLGRVVDALNRSACVDGITVSVESPAVLESIVAFVTREGHARPGAVATADSPSQSVLRALKTLQAPPPYLITTADHALLTPDLVERFCALALETGAAVVTGVTSASTIQAAYPDAKRTYLNLRGGSYSGCNLYAVMDPDGLRVVDFWGRVEQERKRPWRMAWALGPLMLARYLLGRLSLDDAARHISKLTGVTCAAVVLPVAEAAIDVDKPADLTLVEGILRQRSGAPV
ncbi:nucleotidyltransferase family protein [Algihabitans albus]|uniref:nucleotidyltransferase family protein n=1 Tax=Algihabitans albus TaxID=2164067 RepID=UPI000E5D0BFB|nr:nucleotidyltransferase family protein [Algihabitans albus]